MKSRLWSDSQATRHQQQADLDSLINSIQLSGNQHVVDEVSLLFGYLHVVLLYQFHRHDGSGKTGRSTREDEACLER